MDSSVRVIVAAVIVAAVTVIGPKPAEARCLVNCAYDGETYVGYDGYVRAYYGGYYGGYHVRITVATHLALAPSTSRNVMCAVAIATRPGHHPGGPNCGASVPTSARHMPQNDNRDRVAG
jgi:hypothetical protein